MLHIYVPNPTRGQTVLRIAGKFLSASQSKPYLSFVHKMGLSAPARARWVVVLRLSSAYHTLYNQSPNREASRCDQILMELSFISQRYDLPVSRYNDKVIIGPQSRHDPGVGFSPPRYSRRSCLQYQSPKLEAERCGASLFGIHFHLPLKPSYGLVEHNAIIAS
jgi:hypothetical protein